MSPETIKNRVVMRAGSMVGCCGDGEGKKRGGWGGGMSECEEGGCILFSISKEKELKEDLI